MTPNSDVIPRIASVRVRAIMFGRGRAKSSGPFEIARGNRYMHSCRATGYDNKLAMK